MYSVHSASHPYVTVEDPGPQPPFVEPKGEKGEYGERVINGRKYGFSIAIDPNSYRPFRLFTVMRTRVIDEIGRTQDYPDPCGNDNHFGQFNDWANSLERRAVDLNEDDPISDELDRFKREYPTLGAKLAKEYPPRKQFKFKGALFDLGNIEISVRTLVRFQLTRDEVLALIQRHVSGDSGEYGTIGTPPTDDERFIPVLFPYDRRSAVAIARKDGLVRSRLKVYTAEDADKELAFKARNAPGRYHRTHEDFVDVLTLLADRYTRTVITGAGYLYHA